MESALSLGIFVDRQEPWDSERIGENGKAFATVFRRWKTKGKFHLDKKSKMMETLVKKLLKYIAYPAVLFANQISGSDHHLMCDFW